VSKISTSLSSLSTSLLFFNNPTYSPDLSSLSTDCTLLSTFLNETSQDLSSLSTDIQNLDLLAHSKKRLEAIDLMHGKA
jgi:hypothetical protein